MERMFVVPSFEIYGGGKGLYDFGPVGCGLKANILSVWRRHFVMEEGMLEVECTCLTPECVLKTSGHVDRFFDYQCKDLETGTCHRADHLLEGHIDELFATEGATMTAARKEELEHIRAQADAYSVTELGAVLKSLGIQSPDGNPIGEPFPFNLMFGTTIGPEGGEDANIGFLRPETAQGIFVNFPRLYKFNNEKMPFAAAQIGLGFRNEIAPRAGLIRVREFPMAEIEHFCHPDDKDHPTFESVAELKLPLFPSDHQLGDGKMVSPTLREAVAEGIIDNQTLAYFIARVYLFLVRIGVKPSHIRVRQHLKTEMAHYASDCWDGEIHMSYGWKECVGIADRSCFDLTNHAEVTGANMNASRRLAEPIDVASGKVQFDNKLCGKTFRGAQKTVKARVEKYCEDAVAAAALEASLAALAGDDATLDLDCKDGEDAITLSRALVPSIKMATKKVFQEKFTPAVVEPSFGIGRIIAAVLEHSFADRAGAEKRRIMAFKPEVAPLKCVVLPLLTGGSNAHRLKPSCAALKRELLDFNISCKVDNSSGTVGKRYARADEIGVPFAITVDFDSVDATNKWYQTVTVRERDSCAQVRIAIAELPMVMVQLCAGRMTWAQVLAKNTVVNAGDAPAAASAVDARTVRSGYFSRPAVAINIESIETDAAAVDRSAEATRTKVEVHVFKRRQATDAAPSHAQSFDHYYEQSASVAQMSAAIPVRYPDLAGATYVVLAASTVVPSQFVPETTAHRALNADAASAVDALRDSVLVAIVA
jgi:glycyl-tRNA synthetase